MSVTIATTEQPLPVRLLNGVVGVRDKLGCSGNRFATHLGIDREALP